MPIVAKEDGWELPTALWERTRASHRYDPVRGLIPPSGVVTVGAFSAAAQTYTNLATILWNSGLFSTQGQHWQAVDGTPSNGCKNVATPRISGGSPINHVIAFEFLHAGGNLDVVMVGSAPTTARSSWSTSASCTRPLPPRWSARRPASSTCR